MLICNHVCGVEVKMTSHGGLLPLSCLSHHSVLLFCSVLVCVCDLLVLGKGHCFECFMANNRYAYASEQFLTLLFHSGFTEQVG